MFTPHPATPTQNRVHDLAKAEALRLRHEAMQHFGDEMVDDVWRGADAIWQRSRQTGQALAERSAARLAARLERHRRERGAGTPSHNPTLSSGA